jgi:hypothetical protein
MFRKEKKCKNTECDLLINYDENPKKLYCDLKCKNRYHYLKDLSENAEINYRNKTLKTNYKIIVNFITVGIFQIDADVARALGFKRSVYMDLFRRFPSEKNSRSLKRIKDVYFVFDLIDNRIFLYDSNSIKDVA